MFVQLFGLCPDIGLSDIFWGAGPGIGLVFCHKLWHWSLFSVVRGLLGVLAEDLDHQGSFYFFVCCQGLLCISLSGPFMHLCIKL